MVVAVGHARIAVGSLVTVTVAVVAITIVTIIVTITVVIWIAGSIAVRVTVLVGEVHLYHLACRC